MTSIVVSDTAIIESYYLKSNSSKGSKVCMLTEKKKGKIEPFLCQPLNNGRCPSFAACRSGVSGGGDGGGE